MGPKSGTNWSGLRSSFVSGKPWSGISFAYCFDSPIFFKKCLAFWYYPPMICYLGTSKNVR